LILIAADDAACRHAHARALQEAGFVTLEAASCGRAVQIVLTAHPDLVVMDMRMPGVTGFEAARQIRTDPRTQAIPILALIAPAGPAPEGRGDVCDACLTMPCFAGALVEEVTRLLERPTKTQGTRRRGLRLRSGSTRAWTARPR
jgi:CheY-like chemotaxis protein